MKKRRNLFAKLRTCITGAGVGSILIACGGGSSEPASNVEIGLKAPTRACESMANLALPYSEITSSTLVDATETQGQYCNVQVKVTPPQADISINVGVYLPTDWKQRFVGFGGGGYSVGNPAEACSEPPPFQYDTCALQHGFATAATDGGVSGPGDFALKRDGTLNKEAIQSFGHRGIHQMTVTAKQVIAEYYSVGPKYSYFVGESTGGRQAIMEAQRYPADYQGILAGSPAINWTRFIPAEMWPQVVMTAANVKIDETTFDAVNRAVMSSCDEIDGLKDAIISAWQSCKFDAKSLVGSILTIGQADAINKIWEGPRGADGSFLYFGLGRGSPFSLVAGAEPFSISNAWFAYWLTKNPNFDFKTLTYESFEDFFSQSVAEFGDVLATDNVDLSGFRNAGGKLIVFHGTNDEVIWPEGVIDYYNRLTQKMGGVGPTTSFARLFILPGFGHGTPLGGMVDAGYRSFSPVAGGMWQGLVDWVERGTAPTEFLGVKTGGNKSGLVDMRGPVISTRPLCMYPQVARYKGPSFDALAASSFVCSNAF